MGSQNKANLTRVRDNQRRSRARRKEYVLELEKRLRLCELQGVEASFEIQQAARRVVEENKKMRALLNSLGFRNERINSILRTGNLDPAEPIILNPLDDPENMVRTVELLLTPRQLKCPDSRPQTTAPIAAAVVCNSIDNDVANLLGSSQTKVEIRPPKTSTPTPVQLPTSPALSEPNHFEFETQEYSQSLMSSAPPGHPLGGQQQHLSGLVMLPSKPPLVEASEFDTNLGAHEFIYYGRGTNVQRHLEENVMMNSYSSLPSPPRRASSSISATSMFPTTTHLDHKYFTTGQYAENIHNHVAHLAGSSIRASHSAYRNFPSIIGYGE